MNIAGVKGMQMQEIRLNFAKGPQKRPCGKHREATAKTSKSGTKLRKLSAIVVSDGKKRMFPLSSVCIRHGRGNHNLHPLLPSLPLNALHDSSGASCGSAIYMKNFQHIIHRITPNPRRIGSRIWKGPVLIPYASNWASSASHD